MASPAVDWKKMKVQELKEELARRGLDTSGLKAALVQRLEEASLEASAEPAANGSKVAVSSEPLSSKAGETESEKQDKKPADKNLKEVQVVQSTRQGTVAPAGATVTVAPVMSDIEKKQKRAERFGTDLHLDEEEKRRLRAERFGTVVPAAQKKDGSATSALPGRGLSADDAAKLKARAERFGLTTEPKSTENGSSKGTDSDELNKRKQRAERFGMPVATGDDWEAKKKQRAERFQLSKAVVA